jgi:hypothetical protein
MSDQIANHARDAVEQRTLAGDRRGGAALTAIKLAHTLAWFSIESCMVYVLWAGFTRQSDRRAGIAAAVVAGEAPQVLVNLLGGHSPAVYEWPVAHSCVVCAGSDARRAAGGAVDLTRRRSGWRSPIRLAVAARAASSPPERAEPTLELEEHDRASSPAGPGGRPA